MASMKCFGEWAYRAAKLPGMPIRRKKSMQNLEQAPQGCAVTNCGKFLAI
jgi:hypothetical protein